jgi:hypothetical protein
MRVREPCAAEALGVRRIGEQRTGRGGALGAVRRRGVGRQSRGEGEFGGRGAGRGQLWFLFAASARARGSYLQRRGAFYRAWRRRVRSELACKRDARVDAARATVQRGSSRGPEGDQWPVSVKVNDQALQSFVAATTDGGRRIDLCRGMQEQSRLQSRRTRQQDTPSFGQHAGAYRVSLLKPRCDTSRPRLSHHQPCLCYA